MTLARATKKILIDDPFYGFILMSLNKSFSDSISTAGVKLNGLGYDLLVNQDFFDSLPDNQKIGVIKHELLHICMFHVNMQKDFSDKYIFNIAADGEVNQYIEDGDLPEGCVNIFKLLPGTKPRAGVKYYYNELLNNYSSGSDDSYDITNHEFWKEFEDLSQAEQDLIKNQFDYILKEAAAEAERRCGKTPQFLEEYIKDLMTPKPPVFNWRAYVRRLMGNAVEYYLKSTRKRESKRFKSAMGTKHKHKARILVGIDTSGSVASRKLADFFTEINYIYKSGVGIDIAECDVKITKTYPYKGSFDGVITGRGGTSFDPVIKLYNENKNIYTCLVYFTDGGCDINEIPQGKAVWIITSDGVHQNYPGIAVYMPKEEK